MVRLSVNLNKVATLRNARGGAVPSVIAAAEVCLAAGVPGITVHPRADGRHITTADVDDLSARLAPHRDAVEFNIEGDLRADLIAMVVRLRPHQCTLVPVRPGEITSQAGWPADAPAEELGRVVRELHQAGVRVSLFVDPEPAPIRWAAARGADRVELYTEPYARAFEQGRGEGELARYRVSAELAHSLGMGVNAGHDLDLDNLRLFRGLPHLDEVSIGHALISRALFVGLEQVVREYLEVLR